MSATEYSEPNYDIQWSTYFTVGEDATTYRVALKYKRTASDRPGTHGLIGDLYFDGTPPDTRARWHHNPPLLVWLRAHILRLALDWGKTRLERYFEENREWRWITGSTTVLSV